MGAVRGIGADGGRDGDPAPPLDALVPSWSTGPTLGNAEAGAAAALLGLRSSVVVGGALCMGGSAAIAAALPAFWRYDARTVTVPSPSLARTTPAPP